MASSTSPTISSNSSTKSKDIVQSISSAYLTAKKITQKGASLFDKTVKAGADVVGLKEKVEAAEQAAWKLAHRSRTDATKAVNKARRLAMKPLDVLINDIDFDFVEGGDSEDFDLLLSAVGAVRKSIPMHGNYTQVYSVPAGSNMVWKARVKRQDIGFIVKEINLTDSIEIEPLQRYKADAQIQGQLDRSNKSRSIQLIFDNSHSLHGKSIAYWVSIGENVSLTDETIGAKRSKEVYAAENGPSED